jgi:hypothetical protein
MGMGRNCRFWAVLALGCMVAASTTTGASDAAPAKTGDTVASSVGHTWKMEEKEFVSLAEAMPEDKYDFAPTGGEFKGVRTFAQQVKHVACANYGFFNEIEGKQPPEDCEHGGPSKAKGKAELLAYLRESFEYGDRILLTINAANQMDRVEGPYGGPNTKLGIAVLAVWHAADHYGQVVEYLRMNSVVPPASR